MALLQKTVEQHITEHNVVNFIVGYYGNFDRLAGKAVAEAKKRYPEVKLTLLLPYHPAERPIETPSGFDDTLYPPGMERIPRRLAIIRANYYMIDHVDFLIAYVWHPASNAQNFLIYAQKRESKGLIGMTNLASQSE